MVCLDGGNLQKIDIHFWNGNTTKMFYIYSERTLQKQHFSILKVSEHVLPCYHGLCYHGLRLTWYSTITMVVSLYILQINAQTAKRLMNSIPILSLMEFKAVTIYSKLFPCSAIAPAICNTD